MNSLNERLNSRAAGSLQELQRIVTQLRRCWPKTRINIRGDSGFCRDALMAWCEDNRIGYVLGLTKNSRLKRMIGAPMHDTCDAN